MHGYSACATKTMQIGAQKTQNRPWQQNEKKHSVVEHRDKGQIRFPKRSACMPGRATTKKEEHNGMKNKYHNKDAERPLTDHEHCHQNTCAQTQTHTTNATDDQQVHGDMQRLPHAHNKLNVETGAKVWCTKKQHDRVAMNTPNYVINTHIERPKRLSSLNRQ